MVNRTIHLGTSWGGGAWTPASLPSLIGWYEADGTITNGSDAPAANNDLINQWDDQSGGNNHLLANNLGASQTGKFLTAGLNSKKTVYFDGSTGVMICSSFPIGSGHQTSAYIYGKVPSTSGAFGCFICYLAPADAVYNDINSFSWARAYSIPAVRAEAHNSGGGTGTLTLDAGFMFGSIFDGTNNYFVIDGSKSSPVAVVPNPVTAGTLFVAANPNSGSPIPQEIYISALVVTNGEISDPDLASLDSYFSGKWS